MQREGGGSQKIKAQPRLRLKAAEYVSHCHACEAPHAAGIRPFFCRRQSGPLSGRTQHTVQEIGVPAIFTMLEARTGQ